MKPKRGQSLYELFLHFQDFLFLGTSVWEMDTLGTYIIEAWQSISDLIAGVTKRTIRGWQ